jgi:phosphodiesterase/alkaline phosphatase D-like protein
MPVRSSIGHLLLFIPSPASLTLTRVANQDLGRRTFLVGGVAAGTLAALPTASAAASAQLRGNPFTLGVASGDPSADGFVLWTRLALNPLAEDGMGGMPNQTFGVQWQLAADSRFRRVVRSGTAAARPEWGTACTSSCPGWTRAGSTGTGSVPARTSRGSG